MAPQQKAATVGTPKAMMPPVPEPKRACRDIRTLSSGHRAMLHMMQAVN